MTIMPTISRPSASEHAPYYSRYIDLVPEGDILQILDVQPKATLSHLSTVDEEKAKFRYAQGKWSIKEVLGHIIDTERVFAFRAFAFSRNDKNPFPGMEQEEYTAGANYDTRPFAGIVDEFLEVRRASVLLFRNFDPGMFFRKGTASGYEFTVRCFPFIIAGHELHHRQVLNDRYLKHV